VAPGDALIYADLARWEIQCRYRRKEIDNIGVVDRHESFWNQYKRGYFIDWRVCDRIKREVFPKADLILDTNRRNEPRMTTGEAARTGLCQLARRPFRLVPIFDPGPWGGQWMREVCDLPLDAPNYAWCFDCVPEENSIKFAFGDIDIELPALDLVFFESEALLGARVVARFGAEFPIRFDFLGTMQGGNLSLQVHPTTDYIQQRFGVHYTQDESYYLLACEPGAEVFLGLKEGIDAAQMLAELREAEKGGPAFAVEKHVATWPAKQHDHFLIPAGTIHCSGAGCMVLEISATPYIFTFKMWDWGRPGLDGKPRPVSIDHATQVID
jgi:mannose-6-phosphate isomerase class I